MANQQKNRVTVTIMGEEYTIKGTASPEEMQRVALYVDRLMRALAEKNTGMSRHKIAVLTAINLADELRKMQENRQQTLFPCGKEENANELV